jgi:hypothetical protein
MFGPVAIDGPTDAGLNVVNGSIYSVRAAVTGSR